VHWLEYAIEIVGKVEWNTFGLSLTISYLANFGTVSPKYGVFCVLKQTNKKKTQWPLVLKRTIPTERPPLVCLKTNILKAFATDGGDCQIILDY
jgi:hypothetical protein